MNVQIEESWKEALQSEFDKPYFASLVQYLHKEKAEGRQVFPPGKDIFKAFELTPVDKVKVVILGQDPIMAMDRPWACPFPFLPVSLRLLH